jgi:hypothetical protein
MTLSPFEKAHAESEANNTAPMMSRGMMENKRLAFMALSGMMDSGWGEKIWMNFSIASQQTKQL